MDYNFSWFLCGCETWSLTLREEYRLRAFENRVLREIFGLIREEVTGDLRKLHNVELCISYTSSHIIQVTKFKRNGWVSNVAGMWKKRNSHRVLVRKGERKRWFWRPRQRCEANRKMDLKEIGWQDAVWFSMAQDRVMWPDVANMAKNFILEFPCIPSL